MYVPQTMSSSKLSWAQRKRSAAPPKPHAGSGSSSLQVPLEVPLGGQKSNGGQMTKVSRRRLRSALRSHAHHIRLTLADRLRLAKAAGCSKARVSSLTGSALEALHALAVPLRAGTATIVRSCGPAPYLPVRGHRCAVGPAALMFSTDVYVHRRHDVSFCLTCELATVVCAFFSDE